MRTLTKQEAVAEFGLHYAPALDSLSLDLHHPTEAAALLLHTLARFAKTEVTNSVRVVEELGPAKESYQFSDLADAKMKYADGKLVEYRNAAAEMTRVLEDPQNLKLLYRAERDGESMGAQLQAAFDAARGKRDEIDAFLAANPDMKVEVARQLPATLTVPDLSAKTGDKAFVVTQEKDALPKLTEEEVKDADIRSNFFGKPDYTFSYRIAPQGRIAPAAARSSEDGYIGIDGAKPGAPEGAYAMGLNRLVFNSRTAAVNYMAETLDMRATELHKQLAELRDARKKLAP